MRLITKSYDIDDYDVDMIEGRVISTISEQLEIKFDISFELLEQESQMRLVTEIFERVKKDIENGTF